MSSFYLYIKQLNKESGITQYRIFFRASVHECRVVLHSSPLSNVEKDLTYGIQYSSESQTLLKTLSRILCITDVGLRCAHMLECLFRTTRAQQVDDGTRQSRGYSIFGSW